MSLRHTLRSIERRVMPRGPCHVCGGLGSFDTVIVRDGVPNRAPLGCAACGKVRHVKKIILDTPTKAAPS
ncbi:MAG: hypothetical protein IT435_17610 [Phycisphaerales bacterium]|nr:hypothetical protein [Phycisphaerales bacterium]